MNQNAVEYIKNHIKEFLPLEYQDADVIVKSVVKNNDQVDFFAGGGCGQL